MTTDGWENNLSLVANEQTRNIRPRQGSTLLRPVFMNAVEVGYSYAHCDRDKKLNVRGVTIALWHFICRGHQVIALLPYCFKNYPEKTSRYSELMMLYRLNLVEFTPGYGSEKYVEVNRIMINRAFETGGCIVARSQMQGITDNKSNLINLVEKRLLMPTFNGDDIMFPIDGPLGRNGPSLKQTLECEQGTPDWRSCSEHQLLLTDQKHWLEKLSQMIPEKAAWVRINQMVQTIQDQVSIGESLFPAVPLENPFGPRSSNYGATLSCQDPLPTLPYHRSSSPDSFQQLRNFPHRRQSPKNSATESVDSTNSARSCGSRGHLADCHCFGNQNRLDSDSEEAEAPDELMEELRREEQRRKLELEQRKNDEVLAKLSQIFGYHKSSRVMQKFRNIRSFAQLVEKCISEEDREGDELEFQMDAGDARASNVAVPVPAAIATVDDLIDFTSDVVETREETLRAATAVGEAGGGANLRALEDLDFFL